MSLREDNQSLAAANSRLEQENTALTDANAKWTGAVTALEYLLGDLDQLLEKDQYSERGQLRLKVASCKTILERASE